MNKDIHIYRKRIIPEELISLKNDTIVYADEKRVITRWQSLKPRADISYGFSVYLLEQGYKVSKIYDHSDKLVYWYCDIITSSYDSSTNALTVIDLLVDVIMMEDGSIRVLDLDELAEAMKRGLLSPEEACMALEKTNCLLQEIYSGGFAVYQKMIEDYE